jgi:photosystem II stability/assembly factor-like uncharacterized protein
LKSLLNLKSIAFVLCLVLFSGGARGAQWLPFGPYGGDARSIAADPHDRSHLFLGTANGWIYESHNGGGEWKRLARLDNRDDLVLDSIIVDPANPSRIIVGAWVLGSPDGGLYISDDGGLTWKLPSDLTGQSIRALVAAPSDPKTLVAGTLKGVYRSNDGGAHWQLISPAGSMELHEVESIAIDPKDTNIIYAGTWHLPWKTTDGGAHWNNMKQGIIDDSDVFSIIVDPQSPNVVYASACSGIYRSENAGDLFSKIQGIPSTARRTRVLMQDPQHQNIVFAGTTEGLYRTADSGKTWARMSGPELIVNDVFVDPHDSNRVMLATDRGGVLASNDGGFSFSPSNTGFSARQITSFVVDRYAPSTLYVGVVNDKAWGGVFQSDNGGLTWMQRSSGLEGHDVYSLMQAADHSLLAGTRHGFYRLNNGIWSVSSQVTELPPPPPAPKPIKGKKTPVRAPAKTPKPKVTRFDGTVYSFARVRDIIYAATTDGLLKSTDSGQGWTPVENLPRQEWRFVAAHDQTILVTSLHQASLSTDGGGTWKDVNITDSISQIGAVAVDGSGWLWFGGREGVFHTEDNGTTWASLSNLYVRGVNSLYYDEASKSLLITADNKNTFTFSVSVPDKKVRYWNTGWTLRTVRPVGDHLVGATLFDGVVIQPSMVNSAEVDKH